MSARLVEIIPGTCEGIRRKSIVERCCGVWKHSRMPVVGLIGGRTRNKCTVRTIGTLMQPGKQDMGIGILIDMG